MSLTMNYLKQKKLERSTKNKYASKRVESLVLIELKDKLEEYLTDNDKVMIEINPKVVGEFLNILTDTLLAIYDYEQIDSNKFIFYNKEITV